jgi:hypothetical protein
LPGPSSGPVMYPSIDVVMFAMTPISVETMARARTHRRY